MKGLFCVCVLSFLGYNYQFPMRIKPVPRIQSLCTWAQSLQSRLTLFDPVNCSPPGSHNPSMGCSRHEYWNGLPFPPPGDLPNLGVKPMSLASPALQADPEASDESDEPLCFDWGTQAYLS